MSTANRKKGRPLRLDGNAIVASRGERAKRLLKAQLLKTGVSYEELSSRLKDVGIVVPAAILNRKINRGTFSAEFFLGCLAILGVKELRLGAEPPKRQALAEALMSLGSEKSRPKT